MKSLLVCLMGLLVFVQNSTAQQQTVSGQVRLANGLPVTGAQVTLFDLAALRRGAVAHTTTDESGYFALPLATLGTSLPQGFALGQNYPNPFNPSTIIPYQLAATSQVRLEVFNALGQRMATLVDDEQAAGAYQAQWDGTDASGRAVAAGVYLYRLTAGGGQHTERMVLIDGQAGVPQNASRMRAVRPVAEAQNAVYGLVVSGPGMATYVDADFRVETGMEPVAIEMAAYTGRAKVVQTGGAILGDVNNDGEVDLHDALLVAKYSIDPSIEIPDGGYIALGDVNDDGDIDLTDASLIELYVTDSSDPNLPPGIGEEMVLPLQQSLVFILDLSGSMRGSPLDEAKAALVDVLGKPTEKVQEYALMTFGGCGGVRVPVSFTPKAQDVVSHSAGLSAGGGTPLAEALRQAQHLALDNASSEDILLVLLSDGEESCDGDPVAVAQTIGSGVRAKAVAALATLDKKISVNVIGFGVSPGSGADQQLQAIAHATGGNYFRTSETADLATVLGRAAEVQSPRLPTLSGRVTDEMGNPIQGALVQVRDLRENTDANGRYSFPNDSGVQGVDSLIVTAEGFARYEAEVYLFDLDKEFDVELTSGAAIDRAILIAFYHATGGDTWTGKRNWLSDALLSRWQGVETDKNGRVIGLRLHGVGLSGTIPPELANLVKLQRLSLGGNQLSGSIPPELSQLQHLEAVSLIDNELSGSIPPELSQLQHLEMLNLGDNQLSGSIPPELSQLQHLEMLNLGDNQLSGSIPPELGQLRLTRLWLASNQLTGCIPPALLNVPDSDVGDLDLPVCE